MKCRWCFLSALLLSVVILTCSSVQVHALQKYAVPNNYIIPNGLGVYFTPSGLDFMSQKIGPVVANLDLTEIIETEVPGPLGTTIIVNQIILDYGGEVSGTISALPPATQLIEVHIPKAYLDVLIKNVPLMGDVSGNIQVTVDVSGELVPTVKELGVGFIGLNYQLTTSNLETHFEGIAGWLLEFIVETFMPNYVEEPMREAFEQGVNTVFDGNPLFDLHNLFATVLSDIPFLVDSQLDEFFANEAGTQILVEGGFMPVNGRTSDHLPFTLPNIPPPGRTTIPGTINEFDLGFIISDDLINSILNILLDAHFVDFQLDDSHTEPLGIPFITDTVSDTLPELYQRYPQDYMKALVSSASDCNITLISDLVGEMNINRSNLALYVIHQGRELLAFEVSVYVKFDIELLFDPESELASFDIRVKKDQQGAPYVDVIVLDMGILEQTTQQQVKDAVKDMLVEVDQALPFNEIFSPLLNTMQDQAFLGIDPITIGIGSDGVNQDYLVFYMKLAGDLVIDPLAVSIPQRMVAISDTENRSILGLNGWTQTFGFDSPYPLHQSLIPECMTYLRDKDYFYIAGTQTSKGNCLVSVIDLDHFKDITNSPASMGVGNPVSMVRIPGRNILYILDKSSDSIMVASLTENIPSLTTTVATGGAKSLDIVYDSAHNLFYIANFQSDNISVFSTANNTPAFVKTIDLTGHGINGPIALEINLWDELLYVIGNNSNNLGAIDISSAPTTMPMYRVVATGVMPGDVLYSFKNNSVYVTNSGQDSISQFKADTLELMPGSPATVGDYPERMLITPMNLLYVHNKTDKSLSILNADDLSPIHIGKVNLGTGCSQLYYLSEEPADTVAPGINGVSSLDDTSDTQGPYVVKVSSITDDHLVAQVRLRYTVSTLETKARQAFETEMIRYRGDSFIGQMPGQPIGSQIDYYVRAWDDSGNINQVGPFTFNVQYQDEQPPTSRITSPGNGDYLSAKHIQVIGYADDAPGGSGVESIQVSTDNGRTFTDATGTTSWIYTWNSPAEGRYTLLSRAIDNAGNVEIPTEKVIVNIDRTSPIVLCQGYWTTALDSISGGNLVIVALITDEDLAGNPEIFFDGAATSIYLYDDGGVNDISPAGDGFYSLHLPQVQGPLPQGHYLLWVLALDHGGLFGVMPALIVQE